LGVWGGSAGGHLSLLLSGASDEGDPSSEDAVLRVSDRVAAVVAYYPPVDLRPIARGASPDITNTRFPALNFDGSEAAAHSPIIFVSNDDPPTLLIHGDADTLVDVSNSHEMYAALQAQGVVSNVIIIPGAGHGFRGDDAVLATAAMVDWFVEHLGSRPSN
jgi:dipeptidyl aminopeptidase/acylaminoacyl peptidase